MKLKLLTSVGLSLLFLSGTAWSQTQNYYHINGIGQNSISYGNEVIQTVNAGVPIGIVIAGSGVTNSGRPAAIIAKFTGGGAINFLNFYAINGAPGGSICEGVGVVEAPNIAIPGFGLLCYTNAAPAQTVLIKTDLNGLPLWQCPIGALRGASVAYDATLQRFLCLTQVFAQNSNQLQLVVVNANTGAVVYTRYFDGCQGNDSPVTVIHDVLINEYVCLGNSLNTATGDNQIMMVRLTPAGVVTYIRTFGDASKSEIAVDLLRNPASPEYIIGGYKVGSPNEPFFAVTNLLATTATIIPCLGLIGDNVPRRMALINNRYMMVGRQTDAGNVNGFLVSITTTGVAADYRIYGQPPLAGSEELRDISISSSVALPTLMCGTHQRTVAWLGSPANATYLWLVTANNLGAGTCPLNYVYSLGTYAPPITTCTISGIQFAPTPIGAACSEHGVTALNECNNPNRLVVPETMADNTASLYPNPASAQLTAAFVLEDGETATLQLIDMTGRLVRTDALGNQSGSVTLDVANLPEGVYFATIRTGSRLLLEQKVVITH